MVLAGDGCEVDLAKVSISVELPQKHNIPLKLSQLLGLIDVDCGPRDQKVRIPSHILYIIAIHKRNITVNIPPCGVRSIPGK